jgi:hypothetical protein
MCAKQSQKDLFSAFGTLILERLATAGPSFLASPRNEAKRQQQNTKAPSLRTIESAAGGIGSLPRSLAETAPRLFLAPACFKGTLSPMRSAWLICFSLFADKK